MDIFRHEHNAESGSAWIKRMRANGKLLKVIRDDEDLGRVIQIGKWYKERPKENPFAPYKRKTAIYFINRHVYRSESAKVQND